MQTLRPIGEATASKWNGKGFPWSTWPSVSKLYDIKLVGWPLVLEDAKGPQNIGFGKISNIKNQTLLRGLLKLIDNKTIRIVSQEVDPQ